MHLVQQLFEPESRDWEVALSNAHDHSRLVEEDMSGLKTTFCKLPAFKEAFDALQAGILKAG